MALKHDSTLLAVSKPQLPEPITAQHLETTFVDSFKIDVAAWDASSEIALKLSVVWRFYDVTVEHGLIVANPTLYIKPLQENATEGRENRVSEKSEAEKLLAVVPTDGSVKVLRDKVLLTIMPLLVPRTVELVLGEYRRLGLRFRC